MTLHLHRSDGELPHSQWPAEARLRPEAAGQYPTVLSGWLPVLWVAEKGQALWLPTSSDRPVPVPVSCLETR